MFGRKEKRHQVWLQALQASTTPVLVEGFIKGRPEELRAFVNAKIAVGAVRGYISRDGNYYLNHSTVEKMITEDLSKTGKLDMVALIKNMDLSDDVLAPIAKAITEKIQGVWDVRQRVFRVQAKAISDLTPLISSRQTPVTKILRTLAWSEDILELCLDDMAQRGIFTGFIDDENPIIDDDNILHNVTNISNELLQRNRGAFSEFDFFVRKELATRGTINGDKLSKVFGISTENAQELVSEIPGLKVVPSSSGDKFHSVETVVDEILKTSMSFVSTPINFWQQRLDIDADSIREVLESMISVLVKGNIENDEFFPENPIKWLEGGVSLSYLNQMLGFDTNKALSKLRKLCATLGLFLINDGNVLRGVSSFDVYCQLDGSTYNQPDRYFECMNCSRSVCYTCYSKAHSRNCPFCNNIPDFVIDYPRYCDECGVTYVNVKEIIDADKCGFCGSLLSHKWYLEDIESHFGPEAVRILEIVSSYEEMHQIPLRDLIDQLGGMSDPEAINLIEDMIISGQLDGKLDIHQVALVMEVDFVKITCTLCGETFENPSKYYECSSCGKNVCEEDYTQLEAIGLPLCPECSGDLNLNRADI